MSVADFKVIFEFAAFINIDSSLATVLVFSYFNVLPAVFIYVYAFVEVKVKSSLKLTPDSRFELLNK